MNERYFGIDQTGAVNSKGVPLPLKAIEIIFKQTKIIDIIHFKIHHLGDWISTLDPKVKSNIFIDCVLGLPEEVYRLNPNLFLRDYILKTKNYSIWEEKNNNLKIEHHYGRKVAESYFSEILINKNYEAESNENNVPKRAVEDSLKSNSVFTVKPYQKNIQTGTFRIWKQLSHVLDQIVLWPIDHYLKKELNIYLYEVYPSFLYKKILGSSVRSSEALVEYINYQMGYKKNNPLLELIKTDQDLSDSLIAALGGYQILQSKNVWSKISDLETLEGQILGYEL